MIIYRLAIVAFGTFVSILRMLLMVACATFNPRGK